jgi:RNA polymerase I-associated factor PAF67
MSLQVWNVHSVLNVLHSFVEKSNIDQQLEVFNATGGNLVFIFGQAYLGNVHWSCLFRQSIGIVQAIKGSFRLPYEHPSCSMSSLKLSSTPLCAPPPPYHLPVYMRVYVLCSIGQFLFLCVLSV